MFSEFKTAIQRQFVAMSKNSVGQELFRINIDRDKLWDTYLSSFPEGTNPIFRERGEHDCNCCKSFIRAIGGIVAIIDNKIVSIWDINVGGHYQVVADALSNLVKSQSIDNFFLRSEKTVGTDKNYEQSDSGVITWEHFFLQLPPKFVCKKDDIGTILSEHQNTKSVMLRSLTEITIDSLNTVLDLISQNSLYRGEEHKFAVTEFLKVKTKFDRITNPVDRDIFCWSLVKTMSQAVSRIRGTVIGSLLVDLSEGRDLEESVKSYESKVAPQNYKRPTALVTKSMITNAKKTIEELDLTSSLERRFAVLEDITVNNVLFADRSAKKRMGDVFDELTGMVAEKPKNLDKVEEVGIESFLSDILPRVSSIEVLFENKHESNLVSLIAPVDLTSKPMFKWDNKFSWSYTGEMADSIKERVKKAGGRVDNVDLRCSLSWFNYDDLDLHMIEESNRYEIYYGNRGRPSPSYGTLDVDMNAGAGHTRTPVENICYPSFTKMKDGHYILNVHNFSQREKDNVGFDVEIEFNGTIHTFSYPKIVKNQETITVAKLYYSRKDGLKIIESLPSSQTVKEIWGIPTQSFHKVSTVMLSPNHWDNKAIGNKHYFFMLEGCLNDGKARGFFNEFLSEQLTPHRKVLEIVGSKMKTDESNNQLSGLGFSSTQRNSLLCRVKGSFTRTLKINF